MPVVQNDEAENREHTGKFREKKAGKSAKKCVERNKIREKSKKKKKTGKIHVKNE